MGFWRAELLQALACSAGPLAVQPGQPMDPSLGPRGEPLVGEHRGVLSRAPTRSGNSAGCLLGNARPASPAQALMQTCCGVYALALPGLPLIQGMRRPCMATAGIYERPPGGTLSVLATSGALEAEPALPGTQARHIWQPAVWPRCAPAGMALKLPRLGSSAPHTACP